MTDQLQSIYKEAKRLAQEGDVEAARRLYAQLDEQGADNAVRALVANDLGALAALANDLEKARQCFREALTLDPVCECAQENLQLLSCSEKPAVAVHASGNDNGDGARRSGKVAILSFLFNWPSTGGGIVHTVELAQFLSRAGYEVQLIHARYPAWGIGNNDGTCPFSAQALEFDEASWRLEIIQQRFRRAVDHFGPDVVLITDSWNIKPHLAQAMTGYPYFLRMQAQECLCPLNNLRLLGRPDGRFEQCPETQLASRNLCLKCLSQRGRHSGALHQAERALSQVESPDYHRVLASAVEQAAGVLVLNRATAEMYRPFAANVRVVTWGMDPARFPQPDNGERIVNDNAKTRLLFAGLVDETIKGFAVLRQAARQLWQKRQDFEVVVTSDLRDDAEPFEQYVGWQSQEQLPSQYRNTDVTVVPTIAQEGLSRTAVEAMGAGRPVIGSRIGGLVDTIEDNVTGLFAGAGDSKDLAAKMECLLERPDLRREMGERGRERFERDFLWPTVIEREYVPLFGPFVDTSNRRRNEQIVQVTATTTSTAPNRDRVDWSDLPKATGKLGCVLAVQNRSADVLERTLQTYAYQTLQPVDKLLVDYASEPEQSDAYAALCEEYGWRMLRAEPSDPVWSLSAAYNLAVDQLDSAVDVVFKGDVDVLLGADVLETAAAMGRRRHCVFSCMTTSEGCEYPEKFSSHRDLLHLLDVVPTPVSMDGEGIHAYPRDWFTACGGFDLAFRQWGFDDSDLRARADWSIGVVDVNTALLVHQWHPHAVSTPAAERNRQHYDSMKRDRVVVRNGGRLTDGTMEVEEVVSLTRSRRNGTPTHPQHPRVCFATRSLIPELFDLSEEFLEGPEFEQWLGGPPKRHRIVGADSTSYFRELLNLDADRVVNVDEDAFLMDPARLWKLIAKMEEEGYAACGMPDGGVVAVRQHNPLACNAFFNVFDMRRVRHVWENERLVRHARHKQQDEAKVPPFANRTRLAFDDFEPYYGYFLSLLEAGEKILYLDAGQWEDGISTMVKTPAGEPLLLHCWYGRLWRQDAFTTDRIQRAAEFAAEFNRPLESAVTP